MASASLRCGECAALEDALVTMPGCVSSLEAIYRLAEHLGSVRDPAEVDQSLLLEALGNLGQPGRIERPPPLDGISPGALIDIARATLALPEPLRLAWGPPAQVGVALYELTSTLPSCRERNALGRSLLSHLYEARAGTFAAVAARMASGSGRALEAPALRARVHLLFESALGKGLYTDSLALTLVAKRELFERWVERPSRGTLPMRRLASILFERAAREAVRSTLEGDPGPLTLLMQPWVQTTHRLLLADREPLVWRHAAVARGLLSGIDPTLREEIDLQLDPALSPTEWRRAAVSLTACLTHDSATALSQCQSLLKSELATRHGGLLATLPWGLWPVIESEPEVAAELLEFLASIERVDVAASITGLLADLQDPAFAEAARSRTRETLGKLLTEASGGDRLALEATLMQLDASDQRQTLPDAVRAALRAFQEQGAKPAHALAQAALRQALGLLAELRATASGEHPALTYRRLSELDSGALESSRLYDLLLLGRAPGDTDATVAEMAGLYDGLGVWLMRNRQTQAGTTPAEPALEQRCWLSMLHLIDVETATRPGSEPVADRVALRIQGAIGSLLGGLLRSNDDPAHRLVYATLARSFDAALRESVMDVSDLLLLCIEHVSAPVSVQAIVQGSTSVEARHALSAYLHFLSPDGSTDAAPASVSQLFEAEPVAMRFVALSTGLHVNCSYRGEALRRTLLRIGSAIGAIESAGSLAELCSEGSALYELEAGLFDLCQLSINVRTRVLRAECNPARPTGTKLRELLVESTTQDKRPSREALEAGVGELLAPGSPALTLPLAQGLQRLRMLPCQPSADASPSGERQKAPGLPDWLLPRRTIGSFYVVRPLGSGGTSSVFVARRIEARHQVDAELYALKVPFYDTTVARNLSEEEFLQLFRQEAGALLALPRHTNLAQFVNFDAEAYPKPILVMELIEGQSLESAIERGFLGVRDTLRTLQGILDGLAAMHRVGVGHLDVKPANVILRSDGTPVLVDFGLSGRKVRPGCGTLEYCAPEVLHPSGGVAPAPCDVYAFACVAFEAVTGQFLIRGEDERTLVANQMSHDGWPPRLVDFGKLRGARELAVLLARCLRRDPKIRPSVTALRRALPQAGHALENLQWPLQVRRPSLGFVRESVS